MADAGTRVATSEIDLCVVTYNRPILALALARQFADVPEEVRRGVRLCFINNGDKLPGGVAENWPPQVKIIDAPSNLGVAGGRNFAARLADARLIAFLDDDLEFDFAELIPQLHHDSASFGDWEAITYQVVRQDGRYHRTEVPHPSGIGALRHGAMVPYVLGGCLLLRREHFLAEGGFSEELGLYGMEEIEYSYRQHLRGRPLRYSHKVRIVHLKEVTGRLPSADERMRVAVGRMRLARTFLPVRDQITHAALWAAWVLAHIRNPAALFDFIRQGVKPLQSPIVNAESRRRLRQRIQSLGGRVYR